MKNSGQLLWDKAKTIIPGGNQLLSKRCEMFLPGLWPAYYKKANGCEIWDLDGNKYVDFAQMGVGSSVLGYCDPDVNRAVKSAIDEGSMTTLNSYEEVELAELMLGLHPWASMVRYSKTGGEACAIATRIARAASGKDKIAFCGYHGWHDWYISSNLSDNANLDGQLLPGLEPKGVPRGLKGTALPFNYNDIESLDQIIKDHGDQIGVIYMEPQRGNEPKDSFLQKVRARADKINAVLIFDEVTSGFRINPSGIHMKYGVEPDMAIFGKAIGNGYPISIIIGKKEIMDSAQSTFISSTFWTERIGFVAAKTTINKFLDLKVHDYLTDYGNKINEGWIGLSKEANISIAVSGIPPLTHIDFKCYDPAAAQTYYTQEMLKKGYLLGASVYTTYAYSDDIISSFIEESLPVFQQLSKLIETQSISNELLFEKKHSGFKRLT
ncbi:MAG: aminotransferase class III-fold pyridoxal phosphate-dependent enzyme [Saprospirales bacterium]|nr:MAG: aminotransferase class III-fold pyridoxal phosphate-dependent enzyme [Saprospirales bacterium]